MVANIEANLPPTKSAGQLPPPETQQPGPARRRLRHELRQAADEGGFSLQFQPRRALRDSPGQGVREGELLGAEAQLRWPNRRGGVTPAGAFMPLLETYGMATPVLRWSLREACRAAALWPDGVLSITLPAWSLRDFSLLEHVGAALTESHLSPDRIELALDEEAMSADGDDTLLALAALRDLGAGIALDGFGASTANLLTLKRLPITTVKLDRALVRDLPSDPNAAALAQAAIQFAAALAINVVACGVETQPQHDFLRSAGCHAAQGSLCGRSLPEPVPESRNAA
jgi:EAL domain-containing protein (putative c-di-GMP-specific phosphodiesterase class I)